MERNNITDKIMRQTVIVFKGLLELSNDADTDPETTVTRQLILW